MFRASGVWVRGGLGIEQSLVVIVLAPLFFFPVAFLTAAEKDENG